MSCILRRGFAFIQLQCASMQLVFAVIDYIILDKAQFHLLLLRKLSIGTTMVWQHIPIKVYVIIAFVGIAILTVLCVCASVPRSVCKKFKVHNIIESSLLALIHSVLLQSQQCSIIEQYSNGIISAPACTIYCTYKERVSRQSITLLQV